MGADDQLKILVVEENSSNYELLREYFEINGSSSRVECKYTSSGREAVSLLAEWEPTVLLLDLYIEDTNSFDILEKGKDGASYIVVTGSSSSSSVEESVLNAGAVAYVPVLDTLDDIELMLGQILELPYISPVKH